MAIHAEMKRNFERLLVKGVSLTDMPIECPKLYLDRWLKRANIEIENDHLPQITEKGRRLNNFCLGSDPEFVFVGPGSTHKTAAVDVGLKPGLAAGCDQNQRLVELRCWPTTSALEHVAGILTALRWMYRVYPTSRIMDWRAGGYFDNDGMGGHVHFGRKRPTRDQEVMGLDGVALALQKTGFFSNVEWDSRQRGDQHRQRYGNFGDTRIQLHGYEYRTLPSWLESPIRAFTVLTLSKLAVLDPELTSSWMLKLDLSSWGQVEFYRQLKLLVAYHSGRDDDAALLKYLLASKVVGEKLSPWVRSSDFKAAWGFTGALVSKATSSPIIPACIRPLPSEVAEIQAHLTTQKPLEFVENPPTFKNKLPAHYVWAYERGIGNIARSGVGETNHDLVFSTEELAPNMIFGVEHPGLCVSVKQLTKWTSDEIKKVKEFFPDVHFKRELSHALTFGRDMTMVPLIRKTRHFLLKMGLFPIWTVESVRPESYPEFRDLRKLTTKKPHIEERIL